MNYLKENPKGHHQMCTLIKWGNILSSIKIILTQENVQDRGEFEPAKAQVMPIAFIFWNLRFLLP